MNLEKIPEIPSTLEGDKKNEENEEIEVLGEEFTVEGELAEADGEDNRALAGGEGGEKSPENLSSLERLSEICPEFGKAVERTGSKSALEGSDSKAQESCEAFMAVLSIKVEMRGFNDELEVPLSQDDYISKLEELAILKPEKIQEMLQMLSNYKELKPSVLEKREGMKAALAQLADLEYSLEKIKKVKSLKRFSLFKSKKRRKKELAQTMNNLDSEDMVAIQDSDGKLDPKKIVTHLNFLNSQRASTIKLVSRSGNELEKDLKGLQGVRRRIAELIPTINADSLKPISSSAESFLEDQVDSSGGLDIEDFDLEKVIPQNQGVEENISQTKKVSVPEAEESLPEDEEGVSDDIFDKEKEISRLMKDANSIDSLLKARNILDSLDKISTEEIKTSYTKGSEERALKSKDDVKYEINFLLGAALGVDITNKIIELREKVGGINVAQIENILNVYLMMSQIKSSPGLKKFISNIMRNIANDQDEFNSDERVVINNARKLLNII